MEAGGVGTIMNVSASFDSCENVLGLARQYPFVYAAIGVHPDHVGCLDEEKIQKTDIDLIIIGTTHREKFRRNGLSVSFSWQRIWIFRLLFTAGMRPLIRCAL